jgi:imidazolonepropionase-like amidohydrolase
MKRSSLSATGRTISEVRRLKLRRLCAIGLTLFAARGLAQAPAPDQAPKPAKPDPIVELDADRTPTIITHGTCFLKNATLLTVTNGVIKNGDILVRDGKIADIGPNLTAPAGVTVIDATGKFITPGIIDAHSHIALDSVNEGADSITAEVRMHDVIDPQSITIYRGLSNGVTTSLLLHGSANPIGGQSVVVKMKWKRPVEELIIPDAPRMIKFALGENVKQSNFNRTGPTRYPVTRMGVETVYRRAFTAARDYMHQWEEYDSKKATDPNAVPPRRDLRLETLADILRGKIWVQCHSYVSDEMLMMLRLSQEYHFKFAAFQHGLEAYKIAPEIASSGIGVSTFADAWAYKVEANDAIPYNAALCLRAGIVTSVNSDNEAGTYRLNTEAANCMKYGGLTENEALRLVTINPAIQLGVDKRTGSLDKGKDADITVWDGYPLSVYSRCAMTLVEGEVYYQRRDLFGIDKLATLKNSVDTCTLDHATLPTPPARSAYAIIGATIHPVTGPDIANGTIVLEDGKIKAVGAKVNIPRGAYVVQGHGLHVYPGMIDAGSQLGLAEIPSVRATEDVSEDGEFEPDLQAATAVNPDSEHLAITRNNGITTTLVHPTGGTISGQASVIDLAGWTSEKMKIDGRAALHINFPESSGGMRRFARLATPDMLQQMSDRDKARVHALHDYFERAQRYAEARAKNPGAVPYDQTLEAMTPYATGKRPIIFSISTHKGVKAALDFAEELKLKPILEGGPDPYKAADLMAQKHVPYIYRVVTANSLSSLAPPNDWDPTETEWTAPALLRKAGVTVLFASEGTAEAKNLPRQVGIMNAYGLSHDDAIKALTINAAKVLGVADRMGSLETGKMANVIVTDGDPLEVNTSLHYLFIDGKAVPLQSKHTELYNRYRQRLSEIPTTASRSTLKHASTR